MKLFVFPAQLSEAVLRAGEGNVPYARTAEFAALVEDCCKMTLSLLGCDSGRLLPMSCSGSGAMEAVLQNLIADGDRVLVIVSGCFGERWARMAAGYAEVDTFQVPFGETIDFSLLAEQLAGTDYKAVYSQHHETSSGVLHDIEQLAELAHAHGAMMVVDAIGSFLSDELDMQSMGLDVVVISSHKGLCLPAGLAMVALAEGVPLVNQQREGYWNFTQHLASLERGQPLYSPSVALYQQWHARLLQLHPDTGRSEREKVCQKAVAFRELLRESGHQVFASTPSACLTAFLLKGEARGMAAELARGGMYVMPSRLKGLLRVAHVGETTVRDHQMLYKKIQELEGRG